MENIQVAGDAVKTIVEIFGPAGGAVIIVVIAALKFRHKTPVTDNQAGAAEILRRLADAADDSKQWRSAAGAKLDKLSDALQRIEVEIAKKSPRR